MKTRRPCTFSSAIYRIMQALGVKACSAVVRKSQAVVYKWSDPTLGYFPTLQQALELDREYLQRGHGAPPILTAYTAILRDSLNEKGGSTVRSSAQRMSDVVSVMRACAKVLSSVTEFQENATRASIIRTCTICPDLRQLGEAAISLQWAIDNDRVGALCPKRRRDLAPVTCTADS